MDKNSFAMASFYRIMCNHDFKSQLKLPRQFVMDHEEDLSEKVELFAESGVWTVKIEKIGPDRFFTDGWSRFAEDYNLKSMEFLVFRLTGRSKFEVLVYNLSGCHKELHFLGNELNIVDDDDDYETDDQSGFCGEGQNWKFVKKLTQEHTSELEIPRDFAEGCGIVTNRKLKLRMGKTGRKWSIYLTANKHGKLMVRWGWNEFLTGNNIFTKSTISFTYVGGPSNVIEAEVVKNEGSNGKGQLFCVAKTKRFRGRPPKLQA
ncbi:B3 domain-containing protein [Striga asiatica]|uniref:B3 domain-containing protein n=1 Tax=Striga asiatica TaxID=4170 RepID=A0A5A7PT65_STRAF|nr:B3 domain-containing protein [Striga asiatica]